jgi:hypothetical protein
MDGFHSINQSINQSTNLVPQITCATLTYRRTARFVQGGRRRMQAARLVGGPPVEGCLWGGPPKGRRRVVHGGPWSNFRESMATLCHTAMATLQTWKCLPTKWPGPSPLRRTGASGASLPTSSSAAPSTRQVLQAFPILVGVDERKSKVFLRAHASASIRNYICLLDGWSDGSSVRPQHVSKCFFLSCL